MEALTKSIEESLATKNWYAALTVTLILPDISGKIEYPGIGSNKRYANWFNKYVGNCYKSQVGASRNEYIFLSGDDCYALRCSYLHEGTSSITHQRARDVLDDFKFVSPPPSGQIHCNQFDNKLQLQVDIFCRDIIKGVKNWKLEIESDSSKTSRLNEFLKIYELK
ncbi:hypothetical protein QWY31_08200 [Cytophagales bacterium LB-30]|uniref:Uncharacterized protein n=1 Tax=Shiella aurantiaca TaxID=3058365 RepID=A0ABT8F4T7_9BACT|nr:hypothetical protein [Shiella aurantiaca]MDN4165478.1 hypothetical protein [Shiella aurantiaca]